VLCEGPRPGPWSTGGSTASTRCSWTPRILERESDKAAPETPLWSLVARFPHVPGLGAGAMARRRALGRRTPRQVARAEEKGGDEPRFGNLGRYAQGHGSGRWCASQRHGESGNGSGKFRLSVSGPDRGPQPKGAGLRLMGLGTFPTSEAAAAVLSEGSADAEKGPRRAVHPGWAPGRLRTESGAGARGRFAA